MSAEKILGGLAKVRQTSPGEWIACCPAHPDRSPSLAVKSEENGRTLIHCFAGCTPPDILAALGLTVDELFPTPLARKGAFKAPKLSPRAALLAISHEADILYVLACDIEKGKPVSRRDATRAKVCALRIKGALRDSGN